MPTLDNIQIYLTGAWQLMNARSDALQVFDLSADGFWNSFWAVIVAVPVLALGWAVSIADYSSETTELSGRLSILARLAFIDVISWIAPLVVLIPALRLVGFPHRFVPLVIASNWGSALLTWLSLPIVLGNLIWPFSEVSVFATGLLLMVLILLSWRLTHTVMGGTKAQTTGLFMIMLLVELSISMLAHRWTGLPLTGS